METLLILGGMVIATLLIKIATLNPRLTGYKEAVTQSRQLQATNATSNSGIGCVSLLAVIGFLAICALIFYFGTTLASH